MSGRKLNNKIFLASFVGIITLVAYPIIIEPMVFPGKWKKVQEKTRASIVQEDIQPGNMKIWSDPFDRKKDS